MKYGSLNLKSDYSLLRSLIKIDDLIKFAKENDINVLSLCDDNLCGSLEFYNACKKNNIKCIIGLEYNYEKGFSMTDITFEWDEQKNASNKIKHGISFEEACSVFQDSRALVIPDLDHSDDEERFIILGLSITLNMLVVCHCYRDSEQIIRIISARKATKTECSYY